LPRSRRDSAARHLQTAGTREPPAGKNNVNGGGNKALQRIALAVACPVRGEKIWSEWGA
jgi:hypothetical protein